MKKITTYIFLSLIINLGFTDSLLSQGFSHKGTEFIVPNVRFDSYQLITDGIPATVTVEDYGFGTTTIYNLPADTCFQLSMQYYVTPLPFNSLYNFTYNHTHRLAKKSVRITSNTPIYVQAQFFEPSAAAGSFGTYPVIPKRYARNSVTLLTKNRPDTLSSDVLLFVLTSFQDSTDIVVKPTHNSSHGWKKDSTYVLRLDKGEAYTIPSVFRSYANPHLDSTYNSNDFTGTTLRTLNPCHKISVMYKHYEAIFIPSTLGSSSINSDVILEEFVPKEYMRKTSYVVPEKLSRLPDLMHVHAVENNTQVFYNGQYITTLQKNEQWDTLFDEPAKVEGSNPIFVTQYFLSGYYTTDSIDPEMMIAYPIQYRTSNFNFYLNRSWVPYQPIRQLSIITDSFNVNTFTLNGVPISNTHFEPFSADSSMVFATIRISRFQNFFSLKSTGTFQAWVTNNKRAETEAYQSPLDSVMPSPPPPPPYYMDTCLYDTVPLNGKEEALGWLWNTGDTSNQINIHTAGKYWVQNFYCTDTIVDTFDITGFLYAYARDSICYEDSLWFRSKFVSQQGYHYDTTNHIGSCDTVTRLYLSYYNPIPSDILLNDTLCGGDSLVIGNLNYSQSGQFFDTLYYSNGCDSLYIEANIYISQDTTYQYDTICDNETFTFFGNSLSTPGTYFQTETNQIGCDSVIVLELTVNPTHYLRYDTSFCIKDSILVINRIINTDGVNQFPFLNQFGCDSLIEVNITNYCPNIAFIPNSFSPNSDGDNDVFLPVFVNQDEIQNYNLLIFNRWGENLFQSQDVLKGWEGKHQGTEVPLGVYIWKITYQANGETKELIGHLQLVK
ncbi:MAG: gliding motility-associated C-terminal domain-containing protein [Flavobacteriales bacterium]